MQRWKLLSCAEGRLKSAGGSGGAVDGLGQISKNVGASVVYISVTWLKAVHKVLSET